MSQPAQRLANAVRPAFRLMQNGLVAEAGFALTYRGEALADGNMDVRDLAPSLLTLGDLVREVNEVANLGAPPVNLQIRATAAGSFAVYLSVVQTTLEHLVNIFTGDDEEALQHVLDLVAGSAGLFAIIAHIKNRIVDGREALSDNSDAVILHFSDGTTLTVPKQTMALYDRVTIRRQAREVLEPLAREGITEMVFQQSRGEVIVTEADLPSFDVTLTTQRLIEQSTRMVLEIAAPTFIRGNKRRLGDGESTFWATMEDDAFLGEVESRRVDFVKGDLLECDVHISQSRDEDGLHTDRTVLRVSRRIRANDPPAAFDLDR